MRWYFGDIGASCIGETLSRDACPFKRPSAILTYDMPSAEQIANIRGVLQAYQTQVRAIVATHKVKTKKAIEEVDRRKTQKILKQLGKS